MNSTPERPTIHQGSLNNLGRTVNAIKTNYNKVLPMVTDTAENISGLGAPTPINNNFSPVNIALSGTPVGTVMDVEHNIKNNYNNNYSTNNYEGVNYNRDDRGHTSYGNYGGPPMTAGGLYPVGQLNEVARSATAPAYEDNINNNMNVISYENDFYNNNSHSNRNINNFQPSNNVSIIDRQPVAATTTKTLFNNNHNNSTYATKNCRCPCCERYKRNGFSHINYNNGKICEIGVPDCVGVFRIAKDGTIMKDICAMFFCTPCAIHQMYRELNHVNSKNV
ncbi:hypothetical protein HELRODRAFT_181721 [Helobdella robusta]|uniref:Uncharacterized protein n=1 Tax=Helobdella robusta TaxID=6412 RepID=T1FH93_HELRO|nr:hypothetical protein HELRODRAFT_181721 [Helobdella robusta]ESN92104.1 hypothetical protein HELRODRAFT_181721 [Helobdella robusta]